MALNAVLGFEWDDPELEGAIRAGLDHVEKALTVAAASTDPFVDAAAGHLLNAGGKRFRPLVVLLSAQFGDPAADGVVASAVVVELTHLATLYHDDVMDEATLRRGAESANARWDNSIAILTGDFLFARASDVLADLGPAAVRLQAQTFERLVQGQIRETVGPADGADPVEHHLRVISDKTGSLIGTSARFGAMMAGATPEVTDALTEWGERIGVAFQLSDDLLDVETVSVESGKTQGTDLREGIATLPVLLARRAAAAGDVEAVALLDLLEGDLSSDPSLAAALTALRTAPVMAQARAELTRWAERARAALAAVPDVPARRALETLCDYVVRRQA